MILVSAVCRPAGQKRLNAQEHLYSQNLVYVLPYNMTILVTERTIKMESVACDRQLIIVINKIIIKIPT